MKVLNGSEELLEAVGTHLGYSEWVQIDQARIDQFASATGDHQWIHTDPPRAAEGPFGTTIAHGFLTLSLIPMLSWQVYRIAGATMGINYGSNKVRFPAPVPVGSRVRAGVEILSVTPGAAGYQVITRVTVQSTSSDKPACVAETITLVMF